MLDPVEPLPLSELAEALLGLAVRLTDAPSKDWRDREALCIEAYRLREASRLSALADEDSRRYVARLEGALGVALNLATAPRSVIRAEST